MLLRLIMPLLLVAPIEGQEAPKVTERVIELQITPAKSPVPALKFKLLPNQFDMTHGDALASYLKCFMEQQRFYFSPEGIKDLDTYESAKLADLPAGLDTFGGASLRNADAAARMDHLDWLSVTPLKRDGIMTLLPEMQQLRRLSSALKIRARGQVKAGKFEEATETVQTLFALARHLDSHPTVIGNLVGAAVAGQATQPLEEMMEQRGSPNLFWAYAFLPTPLLDFRNGIEGERLFMAYEFGDLLNKDKVWDEISLESYRKKVNNFLVMAMSDANAEETGRKGAIWLNVKALDKEWLAGCKKRLKDAGYDAAKLERFPAEQLVFHDFHRKYETIRDEIFKYTKLPNPEFEALAFELKPGKGEGDWLAEGLARTAVPRFRTAQLRPAQRIALLQTIEALRDFAAGHDGKLPTSLAEIKLPLPKDPVSGNAFAYELKDGKATLKGAVPRSLKESGGFIYSYKIEVRK